MPNNDDESASDNRHFFEAEDIETEIIIPRNLFESTSLRDFMGVATTYSYYSAVSRVVVNAVYQSNSLREQDANDQLVPKDFVVTFLYIARLVEVLGEQEAEMLSAVLSSFLKLLGETESFVPQEKTALKKRIQYMYNLPATTERFFSHIESPNNARSLRNLLPVPKISRNDATEHAMCSPTEVIPMAMFLPPLADKNSEGKEQYLSIVQSESFLEKK
jgi:hypothetical protein